MIMLLGSAGMVLGEISVIPGGSAQERNRNSINVVTVIDKSGSMTWDGNCCYNEFMEPPYSSDPPYDCSPPYNQGVNVQPFISAAWSNWKLFEYLIDQAPPGPGLYDYGGVVFYSNPDSPEGVPGLYGVTTPTPIQRPNAKAFWWHEHLAMQEAGGITCLGPGMQIAMETLASMPEHLDSDHRSKIKSVDDEPVKNYMVVMADGRPNGYWTPRPDQLETGPGWEGSYQHVREIARRASLKEPWEAYSDANDITIFTVGLGSAVDSVLMSELADPFHPEFMQGTPTPEHANHGRYFWAMDPDDLVEIYETIAQILTETGTPTPEPGLVQISMDPASINVEAGQTFLVEIWADASRHEIETLDVHFDYDPIFLSIECVVPMAEPNWDCVQNQFSNANGTMDYKAVKLQGLDTRELRTCTVVMTALQQTQATDLTFVFEPPDRETKAEFSDVDYCAGNVVNATVRIAHPWDVTGSEI